MFRDEINQTQLFPKNLSNIIVQQEYLNQKYLSFFLFSFLIKVVYDLNFCSTSFLLSINTVHSFSVSLIKVNETHPILHYLWSADLSKSFPQLILSILIFSQFSFSIDFSIDCVNIYLFSIFSSIDLAWWKRVGLPHIGYIVIH